MKVLYLFIISALFFIGNSSIYAQQTTSVSSNLLNSPKVLSQNGDTLQNAWCGGLNNCQLGELYLNNDSIKDLLVFDRHGNKWIPLINKGIKNTVMYAYAPEFIQKLPIINNWMQLKDYNNDGKSDIFSYGYGSIKIYKNTSTLLTGISFSLITSSLNSLQNNMPINLYVSDVDYPAITDIDNDGDLDILTFFGLGSFVDLHKNISIETYGHADSLLFRFERRGWGEFMEGVETNTIILDTIPLYKMKHSGSAFLFTDLNNDTYKDVLLSDIGYQAVMALYSNQTKITSVDSVLIQALQLPLFPVFAEIDINNDSKKEIIASSFDPSFSHQKNTISAFTVNTASPTFSITPYINHFLQNTMIDLGNGAYPILYDWDKDGLTDLFIASGCMADTISCKSTIYFYKNTGTKNKATFTLADTDFHVISKTNNKFLYPAFADFDNDLDVDMIAGNSDGTLLYFENINGQLTLTQNKLNNIDVGDYSTPTLYDINGDLKPDLFIGNKDGTIGVYLNNSIGNSIQFNMYTEKLNAINVTDTNTSWYGYSVPTIVQNKNGLILAIGSETGLTYFYSLNYESGSIKTTFISNTPFTDEGSRSSITTADLNNDTYNDFIIGNFSGGCNYVEGFATLGIKMNETLTKSTLTCWPNPVKSVLHVNTDSINTGCIQIKTIEGILVYSKQVTSSTIDIDCNSLNTGVYILNWNSRFNSVSRKIILIK